MKPSAIKSPMSGPGVPDVVYSPGGWDPRQANQASENMRDTLGPWEGQKNPASCPLAGSWPESDAAWVSGASATHPS